MNCSTPGFPIPYYLLELAQTVHWVVDAIQPSHPLSPTSLALTLCQHWAFRSHPTPVWPRLDSLYLQRPWFQIRSHSGIPCRHGLWGDTSTQYRLSFWTATFWGGLRLYCGIQLVDRVNYKESGEKTGSSFPSGSVVKIHLTMQETWAQSQGQGDPLRREWLPIPVFLPGKTHGQRSLMGHRPLSCRVRHYWVCMHTSLQKW